MEVHLLTETQEQIAFVKWLNYHYPDILFWHTPNGEKRDPIVGQKLKNMGVRAGVPDLFFPTLKLFIEMKTVSGKLSVEQRKIKTLLERDYTYLIGRGFKHSTEAFTKFISASGHQTNSLRK